MSYLEDFPFLPERVTGGHSTVHVPGMIDWRGGGRSVFWILPKGRIQAQLSPRHPLHFCPHPGRKQSTCGPQNQTRLLLAACPPPLVPAFHSVRQARELSPASKAQGLLTSPSPGEEAGTLRLWRSDSQTWGGHRPRKSSSQPKFKGLLC